MWKPPSLSVVWPAFVSPSAQDEQQIISGVALAMQAGVITRRMALEKLRGVFPFENVDAVLEQLEGEAKQRTEVEHLLAQAMRPSSPGEDEADEDEAAVNDGDEADDGEEG